MATRAVTHRYQDPLDILWLHAARLVGIRVERDPEVNAAWDGSQVLRIGTTDLLDADDSLAQMILHEMCHALVAGPEGFGHEDWGLVYDNPDHIHFEHAALRLQAAMADRHDLRRFLASTTDYREYYDRISDSPLTGDNDPAIPIALAGMELAQQNGWLVILDSALEATRSIAEIVADRVESDSLWLTARS